MIQGIIGTVGTCPGFFSPIIVGILTQNQVIFRIYNTNGNFLNIITYNLYIGIWKVLQYKY